CPYGPPTGGFPDYLFYADGDLSSDLWVGSVRFGNPTTHRIESYFPDSEWAFPMSYWSACSQAGNCRQSLGEITDMWFMARQTGPPYTISHVRTEATDPPFAFAPTWSFPSSLVSAVKFEPGQRLVVHNAMDAEGVTFTASDPAYGWHGIRFEPGSAGDLGPDGAKKTQIKHVAGINNASVYVNDANVTLDRVFIEGRVQQPADYDLEVAAVWATGSNASVTVRNGSEFTPHTGGGLVAASGATITASEESIIADGVYAWGYGGPSDAFVWDVTGNAPARAGAYGAVWLGPADLSFAPTLPNNTFEAEASYAGSLTASNHGVAYASRFGTTEGHHNNWLFDKGGVDPGFATSEYYSDVDAVYNWWGQASGPDLAQTSVTTGSTFEYCPFLTDPFSGAASTCGNKRALRDEGAASGPAESASKGLALPQEASAAAARVALLHGDVPGALAHLTALLSNPLAHRAEQQKGMSVAARIAATEPGQAARALLTAQARLDSPNRPGALRALAVADAGRGNHPDALASATALIAEGGEHAVAGHVLSALAQSAMGRPEAAWAALEEAERIAPGDRDVAMARREIGLRLAAPGDVRARMGTPAQGVAAPEAYRQTATGGRDLLGDPHPNPTRGQVSVPVTLASPSDVRIEVYDVLGRVVALLHEGPLGSGPHRFDVAARTLVPGTYLVRADLGGAPHTRRFTVVR
ncbi:MAG TPA: T9SS type A sorting domain-containing protein, partial [Rhodothermales bacterium]|nr:T9SS type A sorting domain-containing protein [Rhodothermales bacterium]